MAGCSRISLLLSFFAVISFLPAVSSFTSYPSRRAASYAKYTTAHSLGDAYTFDARDGWTTVNATDLSYKYRRDHEIHTALETRHEKYDHKNDYHKDKKKAKSRNKSKIVSAASSVGDLVKGVWNGLKGFGESEEVKITWYTGHDLENPSCWPNVNWAPTDQSFICALTLVGWETRPQCFKFLELCNGSRKCVFVRVVDSCAGCNPGSKHVDLTKAAFSQLADLDDGVLNVKMRLATEPEVWLGDLWGPKASNN
ncbi:hypothetical protein BDZ89DRAFT_1003944 [Hymenopellis radicata]|nr:hypothetical protein BDZ89DRAFT_1003944 [Hymenopellis radicata]